METDYSFRSDNLKLDALVEHNSTGKGIVITHPHPLYGGNMYNPVVEMIRNVYLEKGYTTLRFNFRGTGKSQGKYDDGQGEQTDVYAAVDALRADGLETIDIAGYSFGAWVNARAVTSDLDVRQMVMVSPPVAMIDFSDVGFLSPLDLVITGGRDDIAPPAQIKKMLSRWNPSSRFKMIESADHFYGGFLTDLGTALAD